MKRFLMFACLCLCVLPLMGCEVLDEIKNIDPYQATLASVLIIDQSTQDSYKGIRTAYLQGAVSDEDMAAVDAIYTDYELAHKAVCAAAVAYEGGGDGKDIDGLVEALKKIADRLNLQAVLLEVIQ